MVKDQQEAEKRKVSSMEIQAALEVSQCFFTLNLILHRGVGWGGGGGGPSESGLAICWTSIKHEPLQEELVTFRDISEDLLKNDLCVKVVFFNQPVSEWPFSKSFPEILRNWDF